METHGSNPEPIEEEKEYRKFIWTRLLLGICITIGLIWAAVYFADRFVPEKRPAETPGASISQTAAQQEESRSARPAEEPADKQAETAQPEAAPEQSEQAHPPETSQPGSIPGCGSRKAV
ncbi:MAG: hypothetical protein ACLFUY_11520 [Desulfobacterales bacterium]